MAAGAATQEALWLRSMLSELHFPMRDPTVIKVDDTSAKALAYNPVFHKRTKHIEIKEHFIREHIANGEISLEYIETKRMVADIFTKPTKASIFRVLINTLRGERDASYIDVMLRTNLKRKECQMQS